MSEALNQVIERASTDVGFRSWLQSDSAGALAGYPLTPEEQAALMRGDHEAMQALGLDARVTKLFGDTALANPAEPGDAYPQGPWS